LICINLTFLLRSWVSLHRRGGRRLRVPDSHGVNTMMTERLSCGAGLPPGVIFQNSDQGLHVVGPADYRLTEVQLRSALAQSEAQSRQQDELIQRQDLLSKESDHRLMNDLQMIISLLSLQSRSSMNAEVAAQLAVAANRVSMIARIHHRLHSCDGAMAIDFKKFLEDFGHDFSAMLSSDERSEQVVVEDVAINLPAATAIPLGFIVSGLIANAAKHGQGRIAIDLQPDPECGYALSVSNGGRPCRKGSTPAPVKGWE
jgi:two-component sensor histidine kinase